MQEHSVLFFTKSISLFFCYKDRDYKEDYVLSAHINKTFYS